jgi:hypothetical protein
LKEDPVARSLFTYNGEPVFSKADNGDLGEILSSVLHIFSDAAGVKFSFIADELAERLNLKMFELFKSKFASHPGKVLAVLFRGCRSVT